MSGFVIVSRGITRALTHPLQSVCGSYNWEAIFCTVRDVVGERHPSHPCTTVIYPRLGDVRQGFVTEVVAAPRKHSIAHRMT